jgi:uncharacterized phage protein (TIGR02220 family)
MKDTVYKTIEYLNFVTGSDYSDNFPATMNALNQLIAMGYGLADFKKVIDKKWQHWKGTKYQNYVRPSTLFGKNFENYLNEERTSKNSFEQLKSSVSKAKQANWRLDSKRS